MNKKTMFKNFLKWITFVLCGLPLSAAAQVLNTPTAESPVHFANTTDFSAGTLTVSFQLGGGQNTAEVEITLPQGIEYAGAVLQVGLRRYLRQVLHQANPCLMLRQSQAAM